MPDTARRTVHRYEVDVDDTVELPGNIRYVLSAARSRSARPGEVGKLELWALVYPDVQAEETMRIFIRGTGHPMTGQEGAFIATVIDGPLVWHLFSQGRTRP